MVTHGSDMWQWACKIALFGADFCWENRGFGVSQCSNKPKTSHWRPWKTCWESGWNTFSFKILSNWFQVFSTQISVNHFTCIIEGGPYWPSWTKKIGKEWQFHAAYCLPICQWQWNVQTPPVCTGLIQHGHVQLPLRLVTPLISSILTVYI